MAKRITMEQLDRFERNWDKLTEAEQAQAQLDYDAFFTAHEQSNPCDLNTLEKYEYAFHIGPQRFAAMLAARKVATTHGHDWTRLKHWRSP